MGWRRFASGRRWEMVAVIGCGAEFPIFDPAANSEEPAWPFAR